MTTLDIALLLFGAFVWIVAFIAVKYDRKARRKRGE